MGNTVINVIGVNKSDIILYISSMLLALGNKILIVDNSLNSEFVSNIYLPDNIDTQAGLAESYGIYFTRGKRLSDLNGIDAFDYVFMCYGLEITEKNLSNAAMTIVVTDLQRSSFYKLFAMKLAKCDIAIVRDVVRTTVTAKDFFEKLEITNELFQSIPFNERDLVAQITNQNSHTLRYNNISGELKDLIIGTTSLLTHEPTKEVSKLYKRISKGV